MNNSAKKYFQIQKIFVFIFAVFLLLPINIYAADSIQKENIFQKYLINPISQIFLPWFSPRENTNTVIIKTENVSTSSPREAEAPAKVPLTINYPGVSKEEVSKMITGAISGLPTPIQNYYPSTYITNSSGSTQGVADSLGRTSNTLQTNIDNLSSTVSSILTTPSITGEASFASSLLLSQISAPSDTSNRLYNTGGNLYWAGNLIGGGSVGNWTLSGGDAYRLSGNVGIGTSSPFAKLSVVGDGYFTSSLSSANLTATGTVTFSNASLVNAILGTNSLGQLISTTTLTINNVWATSTTATNYFGGNVGIGTAGPTSPLQVQSPNTTGNNTRFATNDFNGTNAGTSLQVKFGAITGNTSSQLQAFTGGETAYGNLVLNGNGGNVGIGTTTPWRTLSVNGTVAMPALVNDSTGFYVCLNTTTGQLATSTGVCGASSIKYKENVQSLSYGLDDILKLKPVSFDYKNSYIKNAGRQIGFIAEEVAPVIPEVVSRDSSGEIQGLDYPKFTAVLAKAIQELNKKFDDFASSTASVIGSVKNLVLDSLTSTTVYTREITADKANVVDFNVSGKMNINSNVCVNNTCITKDQFEQMILRSGVGAVQFASPVVGEVETNSPDEVLNEATSTPVIEEQNTASTTPVSNDTDENVSATSTDSTTE